MKTTPVQHATKTALAKWVIFIVMFLSGALAGSAGITAWNRFSSDDSSTVTQVREHQFNQNSAYKLIDPLLACSTSEQKNPRAFTALKDKLDALIKTKEDSGDISTASIYFDTRDGRWLGINTAEQYFPGSLMKVPTMIAYLKVAESDPALLTKKLRFADTIDYNANQYYPPSSTLKAGESYTVKELLERTIKYSDNNAVSLLVNNIDPETLADIYTDIGVRIPSGPNPNIDFMNVKDYAHFFRILYNGSYLNWSMSEMALEWLAAEDFPPGIDSGVPANVMVAQKFGEHYDPSQNAAAPHELHDCGIIYKPNEPYLLCIMTKGTDYDRQSAAIRDISKTVYNFLDSSK